MMSKSINAAVQIQQATKQKKLSTAQKKFNNLIKKIDKEKKRLQEWQTLTPDFQKKLLDEYQPLLRKLMNLQAALVRRLDEFHNRRSFTQTQNNKISHVICELCTGLIDHSDADDLQVIYEKHSGTGYGIECDEFSDLMGDMMKEMFEDQLGIDLGDDFDHTDPEAFARHVAEKMRAAKEADQPRAHKTKKQTKHQAAQEQRRIAAEKVEQENISQSIKTIYRQLSTAAHPDRETEPEERARKTEIMQRVNMAYAKKDLLKLLALQLELEQIDQNHINTIAEDRLKAYNQILESQLAQLQMEIEQAELPFRMSARISPYAAIRPNEMMHDLERDARELRQNIDRLDKELKFLTTVKNMKIWLKNGGLSEDAALPGNLFDEMDMFDLR
ncbi:MAG TPA: molecular chaperone DnaJ [Nitrosomonas sp.]|nr:molecular chaperone DnaJ [Nitrosomonas sp.]